MLLAARGLREVEQVTCVFGHVLVMSEEDHDQPSSKAGSAFLLLATGRRASGEHPAAGEAKRKLMAVGSCCFEAAEM